MSFELTYSFIRWFLWVIYEGRYSGRYIRITPGTGSYNPVPALPSITISHWLNEPACVCVCVDGSILIIEVFTGTLDRYAYRQGFRPRVEVSLILGTVTWLMQPS